MRTTTCTLALICSVLLMSTACFEEVPDPAVTETGDGDGDGDPSGDGDGDPSGDGDGDPSGDGDGDPSGDGDGDPTGDGDGDGDTGPMCTPEETDCSGECVVLTENAAHCGACGHDCLGGACNDGVCEPVELASGKGRLFMALVDQDHLYYGGDGVDVGRIDKDGQNDMVLVPAGEYCYDSAFTGDAIVWGNDWAAPGVRGCMVPDCAGGVQTFFPGMNLFALEYDAVNNQLYWNQGPDLVSAAWPNGNQALFEAGMSPRELDSDGDDVYWASAITNSDFRLRRRPVGGGPVVDLVINRPAVRAMVATPNKLFWAEDASIFEAPLPNGIGGADPNMLVNVDGVRKMTADSTHVYWTSNQDQVGTVARCPIAGCDGPPEVLMQVSRPWGIVLDPVAVYFVTEDGFIYKVAK